MLNKIWLRLSWKSLNFKNLKLITFEIESQQLRNSWLFLKVGLGSQEILNSFKPKPQKMRISGQFQNPRPDSLDTLKSQFLTFSQSRVSILTVTKLKSRQSRKSWSRSWLVPAVETPRLSYVTSSISFLRKKKVSKTTFFFSFVISSVIQFTWRPLWNYLKLLLTDLNLHRLRTSQKI